MSIIAEYTIDPGYVTVMEDVPNLQLEIEQVAACTPDTISVTLWAHSDDFAAFEAVLERADVITRFEWMDEQPGMRRLYQIRLPAAETTYWKWMGLGGVLLDGQGTLSGLQMRMRFPHREALLAYRDHCRERGISFTLDSLHNGDKAQKNTRRLTTPQHDMVVAAVEMGYFQVPRGIRMTELAEQFGISDQAASERMRRGLSNLLDNGVLDHYPLSWSHQEDDPVSYAR